MRLKAPTNATEAYNNCLMTAKWDGGRFGANKTLSQAEKDAQDVLYEEKCKGPWIGDENGNWKQAPATQQPGLVPTTPTTTTTTTTTKTAGVGDNKMLIWLIGGGLVLWYLNKEGYLKKILK
jgi:hypothetical protein